MTIYIYIISRQYLYLTQYIMLYTVTHVTSCLYNTHRNKRSILLLFAAFMNVPGENCLTDCHIKTNSVSQEHLVYQITIRLPIINKLIENIDTSVFNIFTLVTLYITYLHTVCKVCFLGNSNSSQPPNIKSLMCHPKLNGSTLCFVVFAFFPLESTAIKGSLKPAYLNVICYYFNRILPLLLGVGGLGSSECDPFTQPEINGCLAEGQKFISTYVKRQLENRQGKRGKPYDKCRFVYLSL